MWRETFCHPLYFAFLISWNCDLQATFTYFPLFICRILWIVPQLFYFYLVFLVHLFYIHHLWRKWLQFMPVLLWKSLVIINCFGFSPVSSFHFASGGWRLATIPLLLHFQYFTFYLMCPKETVTKVRQAFFASVQSGELHWTLLVYRCSSFTVFFYLFSFPASCLDRYGLIHQARISASVNAMRVLNTGTEVEAAVADALVSQRRIISQSVCLQEGYNQRG